MNIKDMPLTAASIVKIVDFPIRSPRKSQAMAAVMKGNELSVKVVAATDVFVIACKNAIPAKAIANRQIDGL